MTFFVFLAINPEMNAKVPILNFLAVELVYAMYVYWKEPTLRKLISSLFFSSLIIALLFTFTTSINTIAQNVSNREFKAMISMMNSFFSLCFPVLLMYRLLVHGSKWQKYSMLIFSSVVLFIILQVTMAELAINERILKSQMSSDMEGGTNAMIGGYSFVCAAPMLAASSFYAFIRSKKSVVRWVLLAVSLFFVVFMSKSMYAIALLAGVFGMSACLYSVSNSKNKKMYIIAPIILWFIAPAIIQFVVGFMGDGDTRLRLLELYDFFTTGEFGDDDLGARMELYGKGMATFFSNPIWGAYNMTFNPHSTAIEILASEGILGFIPFYLMLKKSFNMVGTLLPSWSVLPCLLSFGLMCMTNPIHASLPLNISLWFLSPLLYNVIENLVNLNNYDVPK